ncbi:MAG: SNF2-related protein [Gemmatimonadota bacterium]
MKRLNAHPWELKYTPDDGDLVDAFFIPALGYAVQYDRSTGYFRADVLELAIRGVEQLLANHGRMRLIVGCTLNEAEVEAIKKGEELRATVEKHLAATPLLPPDDTARNALELLAWMVQHGMLEIKVAIPCDTKRRPIPAVGIFHEKSGVMRDAAGDRIAFNGSVNETPSGWKLNWESFNVFTSWGDAARVTEEEESFARIWANQAKRVLTIDVPQAARDDLLRFLPLDDKPARLHQQIELPEEPPIVVEPIGPDPRAIVWSFIAQAATLSPGGERVGEATAAVEPWPHQVRAFQRIYSQEHPRLLIADEVGLGKTIQAGMVLRQLWLAGRLKRALILAPAAVLQQWQLELREKFNLSWPIYDESKLLWLTARALPARPPEPVERSEWHKQPFVIASSHLMRRSDRQTELCEDAEPWDLVILDEAHHARRSGAGGSNEKPNRLLQLMTRLRGRTKGLLLLTATPMQVHPIEVWDLLSLLGLPDAWSSTNFLRFHELIEKPSPDTADMNVLATQFRASEHAFGPATVEVVKGLGLSSNLKARKVLNALRDESEIPRRQLENEQRRAAIKLMKRWSPIAQLASRNTRDLLRRYFKAGRLETRIADRSVEDRFIDLSPAERLLYEQVEDYISNAYQSATASKRTAVGFVMTIYRRRIASSFRALQKTLEARRIPRTGYLESLRFTVSEDASDDESQGDVMDAQDTLKLEKEVKEDRAAIDRLLAVVKTLPVDSKTTELVSSLRELAKQGYALVMVFTQYTDTMDFLRVELVRHGFDRLLCLSGRGGEAPTGNQSWTNISRDEVKRRFREGVAQILLCTDAAAEGLNFQFCGALINYDMPWNPMRVEQRIGRIDRLGQKYDRVQVINLHYRGTVEADVYQALRSRIKLFESVVGRLQPILSRLSSRISNVVLQGSTQAREQAREETVHALQDEIEELGGHGFDLDEYAWVDLPLDSRPSAALTLDMLDAVISRPDLLPPGFEASRLATREYSYLGPGLPKRVRVTTDSKFYEENPDSVELWSPGSPLFPTPDVPEFTVTKHDIDEVLHHPVAPS